MGKKPFIIIFHFLLFILGIAISLRQLMDQRRYELTIQFLGKSDAYFDYFMSTVLLAMSIILFFGYLKAKKWAFQLTFYYYILYFLGLFVGLYLLITRYDEFIKAATIIRYGEVRELPFTFETFLAITIGGLIIKLIISYFSLRYLHKNKDYFTN